MATAEGCPGPEELVLEEDHANFIGQRLIVRGCIERCGMKDPTDHALLSADLIADTLALTHSLRNDEAGRKGTDRNGRGSPSGSSAGRERSIERKQIRLLLLLVARGHSLNELDQRLLCRCTTSVLAHNHARADRNPTASSKRRYDISSEISSFLAFLAFSVKTVLIYQNGRAGL